MASKLHNLVGDSGRQFQMPGKSELHGDRNTGERTERAAEVSIVIPCHNERNFIAKRLDSVLANDFPKDEMEILVVDRMSEDGTREIVTEYMQRFPFIGLTDNPRRVTPYALNIGIAASRGEIVCGSMRMQFIRRSRCAVVSRR